MEAKNVRIGNKVDLYGKTATICSADYSTGLAITKGKPIELTTEWLIKLGFKKLGNTYWISLYVLKAELHFEMYKRGRVLLLKSDNSNLILEPVMYVHQMQNLFFALTNTEIEFKHR